MTIHKSQESGFDYMLCDLNGILKTGKENTVPVVKGQFKQYCLVKKRENVQLINLHLMSLCQKNLL